MNQTLTRWLACGACAAGTVVFAGEPAATLLPVRAVDAPPAAVARAAPPSLGSQFQAPAAVPAPGVSRPQPQPQYQPQYQPQFQPPPTQPQPQPGQPQPQPSVWGGVKSMLGAKPGEQPQVPPAEPKPWWPTAEQTQPPQPPKPPPGTYAGSPAYRWYGYGTPTAGANPFAPNGRYPQASDNWFTQTGATPGAFPVPVGGPPLTPREQPVVVHAHPQEPPRPIVSGSRPPVTRTAAELPDPVPSRLVVAETPRSADRREPVMPSGAGLPVPIDPNTPDVSWQPAAARTPIATTPPEGTPQKTTAPPADPNTDWAPSRRPVTPDAPLPTVSISRGQAPAEAKPVDVEEAVRSACFGRASRVGVSRPGPQRLHVTLVVPSEADARDAAAVVSRLPEVKAYAVTFEAVIGK